MVSYAQNGINKSDIYQKYSPRPRLDMLRNSRKIGKIKVILFFGATPHGGKCSSEWRQKYQQILGDII